MKKAPTLNEVLTLLCIQLRAANPGWYFTISTAAGTRPRQYARVYNLYLRSEKGTAVHAIGDLNSSTTGLALLRTVDRVVYDEMQGWNTAEGSFAFVQPLLEQYLKENRP
jgi:hypothetical protein